MMLSSVAASHVAAYAYAPAACRISRLGVQKLSSSSSSSSSSSAFAGHRLQHQQQPRSSRVAAVRGAAAAAMAGHDLEVFGKAASGTGNPSSVRGDCPFSQRTYLDLEEKGLKAKYTYIEEGPNENKPKTFMEHNPSGLIPVLRDGETWIQDSDKIAAYLEEKFPEPALKPPPGAMEVGSDIFPTFTSWLQAKDPNSPKKQDYEKALASLEESLKKSGPYAGGEKFTEADCSLAPKLLHARISLEHFYGFKIPSEYTALQKYFELVESRPSFKASSYPLQMIPEGWAKKFELPGQMIPASA